MKNNYSIHYGFTHSTGYDVDSHVFPQQSNNTKNIVVGEGSTWHTVVREFTNFLSGIYGYDISEQVFVKDSDWSSEEATYVAIKDSV